MRVDQKQLDIHFFIPESQFPDTRPTISDIHSSKDRLSDGPQFTNRSVVRVGKHFAVKFDRHVAKNEAETMDFVWRKTNGKISMPRVYCFYDDHESGRKYIVMQYIEGDTLRARLRYLRPVELKKITATLRSYVDELRKIRFEQGEKPYLGSIHRQEMADSMFTTQFPTPTVNGPLEDDENLTRNDKFVNALVGKFEINWRWDAKFYWYEKHLGQILHGGQPPPEYPTTFTHADLQSKNIIIQHQGGVGEESKFAVTIIDWEKGGWYPSYWEYCCAMSYCNFRNYFSKLLEDDILDPYPQQLWGFSIMRQEIG